MKHNAMLKSEYDEKLKRLKEKWAYIESCSKDEIPSNEDIEKMVGLVNKKVQIKTMHDMIKEKTVEVQKKEEVQAREFVKRMKVERLERLAFQKDEQKKLEKQREKELKEAQDDKDRKAEELAVKRAEREIKMK